MINWQKIIVKPESSLKDVIAVIDKSALQFAVVLNEKKQLPQVNILANRSHRNAGHIAMNAINKKGAIHSSSSSVEFKEVQKTHSTAARHTAGNERVAKKP